MHFLKKLSFVLLLGTCFISLAFKSKLDPPSGSISVSAFLTLDSYPIINVSDYSGSTDSERIQSALNDVPSEGAIVFVPEGVWEAGNLSVRAGTILVGSENTVIRRPANMTDPFLTFNCGINFGLLNMTFDGLGVPLATGIHVANGTNICISNNTFQNIGKNAIYVCGESTHIAIEKNTIKSCSVAPILLFGSPGSRLINDFNISYNRLVDCADNGKIGVAFSENGTISHNSVVNCTFGVGTRCVSNLYITNNTIENCSSYGIYLGTQPGDEGSFGVRIAGNGITGCQFGLGRYYGSGQIANVTVEDNSFIFNREIDLEINFKASFIGNLITEKSMVKLTTTPSQFTENRDINGSAVIPADITGDFRVDMRDLGLVARLYMTCSESPNWNAHADVIQDDLVDMRDIGFTSFCFSAVC